MLTSRLFVAAVVLLVLNDHLLKTEFPGWWTGKLSDFAGLFAFAVFWAALLPRHRRLVFVATALGFVIWKSPLSDGPLTAWNALGTWPLARVVDYTDLFALVVLIPACRLLGRREPIVPAGAPRPGRRLAAVTTGTIAAMAFAATSVAPPMYPLPDATPFVLPASIEDVRAGLRALDSTAVMRGRETGVIADTLSMYIRQPPERLVLVTFELREAPGGETRLTVLSVQASGPEPQIRSIERELAEQVLDPLRAWLQTRRPAFPE